MNKNDQEFLVQKIRSEYTEKEHTQLDELKALDAKVKRPANVFAYVFGSLSAIIMGSGMSLVMTEIGNVIGISNPLVPGIIIGALVMGAGMSLVMTDIGAKLGMTSVMVPGIVIGVVGMIGVCLAYPVYQAVTKHERERIAPEIIRLSDELLK